MTAAARRAVESAYLALLRKREPEFAWRTARADSAKYAKQAGPKVKA